MQEHSREYQVLREVLSPGEVPKIEIIEHRLGGGMLLAPAHVYATDGRIIIIRESVLGHYRKIKMIKYENITEVKLERAWVYCKLHFGLQGELPEADPRKAWLYGLDYNDAMSLIRFMNSLNIKPPVAVNK